MADTLTLTYDFVLPEVGASDNTWGGKINANFTALDLLLSSFFTGGAASDPGDVQPFTIADNTPRLNFKETDQTAPAGLYRYTLGSDVFALQRAVTADFVTAENVWLVRGGESPKTLDVGGPYQFRVTGGIAEISGATPTLRFTENDAVSPLGRWRMRGYAGGAFSIGRTTVADWTGTDVDYLLFSGASKTIIAEVPVTIDSAAGSNLNFSNAVAANPLDLSMHISLNPNGYGFNITGGGHLNYVTSSTAGFHSFYTSSTLRFEVGVSAGGVSGVTAYCDGHFAITPGAALVFGDLANRIQRVSGGQVQFVDDDVINARVELAGPGMVQPYSIATREKGDARWAAVSSQRYKDNIRDTDEAQLADEFDSLTLREWTWGGELDATDERTGTPGLGLIAEEVEQLVPDAVSYQWHEGVRRANGLDPLALIAVLVAKVRQLEERLEGLT